MPLVSQNLFFRTSAQGCQDMPAQRIKPLFTVSQHAAFDQTGQRQVHIIASQHEVFSHSYPFGHRRGLPFPYTNQGKIGRASSDITNQDDRSRSDYLIPVCLVAGNPRIKRSLGLFKERHMRKAGLFCSL